MQFHNDISWIILHDLSFVDFFIDFFRGEGGGGLYIVIVIIFEDNIVIFVIIY